MNAEHARQQLDEQHTALEERLTRLYRNLAELASQAEEAQGEVRRALQQLDELREAGRTHARAVQQEARGA